MIKRTTPKHLAFLFLVLLIIAGCSRSSMKIGWRETSSLSHKRAAYDSFSGTERYAICAREGDLLEVDYILDVFRGTLHLSIEDPVDQTLWDNAYSQDVEDTVQLTTSQRGCYQLLITGYQTAGSFDLDWSLER